MGWLCLSNTCNGMLPEAAWNNCGNFAHKIRLRHQVQRTSLSGGTLATGQLQRGGGGAPWTLCVYVVHGLPRIFHVARGAIRSSSSATAKLKDWCGTWRLGCHISWQVRGRRTTWSWSLFAAGAAPVDIAW